MSFPELLLVAIGLSMDAFAVSVCTGLKLKKAELRKSLIIGLYFGFFQAAMPLIGYLFASQFNQKIIAYDHWIAFVLLSIIGIKMIRDSFQKEACPNFSAEQKHSPEGLYSQHQCSEEVSLGPRQMLPLAVATSIDALAVGVSFAFLRVDIIPTILSIGSVTLILSVIGVKIGHSFGTRFKKNAELAGGIILILIGLKILGEHLGLFTF